MRVSVYPSTIRKCFFSNMPQWIFVVLGYNDDQVCGAGDNRGVQEFGVKGHWGVILGNCSNMLKRLPRLHNSVDLDETWVKRSRGSFRVYRNIQGQRSTLCQPVPVGLKFDWNDSDNIQNRCKLPPRSYIAGQRFLIWLMHLLLVLIGSYSLVVQKGIDCAQSSHTCSIYLVQLRAFSCVM